MHRERGGNSKPFGFCTKYYYKKIASNVFSIYNFIEWQHRAFFDWKIKRIDLYEHRTFFAYSFMEV